jgi:hypothetical protein
MKTLIKMELKNILVPNLLYYKNLCNIVHYIQIGQERLYNMKLLKKHFYNNKIVRLKKLLLKLGSI